MLSSGIATHHWDDMGYGIIVEFHMHNQVNLEPIKIFYNHMDPGTWER